MTSTVRRLAELAAAALLLAACGGGDTTATAPTPTPPPAPPPVEATTEPEVEETTEPEVEETTEPEVEETTEPEEDIVLEGVEQPTADVGDTMGAEEFDDVFSGGGGVGDEMTVPEAEPGTEEYSEFVVITDDSGSIQVAVPAEWSDVDGRPFEDEQGRQLFDVRAASDLEAFQTTWTTPGVIVTASQEVAQSQNEVTLLDELVPGLSSQCTYEGREPYSDPAYTGQFDLYSNCGDTDATYVVVGAVPSSRAFVIRVEVQVNAERDLQALDAVLQSFEIVGDV